MLSIDEAAQASGLTAHTLRYFGSVKVPYYLDDDWADFAPQVHGW